MRHFKNMQQYLVSLAIREVPCGDKLAELRRELAGLISTSGDAPTSKQAERRSAIERGIRRISGGAA